MKLIFVTTILNGIGGIQSSLLNLIENLVQVNPDVEISLCVLSNQIETFDRISSGVTVVAGVDEYLYCIQNSQTLLRHTKKINKKIRVLGHKTLMKLIGFDRVLQWTLKDFKIPGEYDVAIAWSNDMYKNGHRITGGCYDVVIHSIEAKKKFAWIHNECKELGFERENCLSMFKYFDGIVNVSANCKAMLDEIVPEYKNKSYVVNNTVNEKLLKQAVRKNGFFQDNKKIHLVTVCRIKNQQKRLDRIIEACKKMKLSGQTNYCWYIIGDGPDLEKLRGQIKMEKLENQIICLGKLDFPFDYVINADLFVLSSKYEAFPMTLIESISLGTPVLSTNYVSAREIIKEGENGFLCENSSKGFTCKVCDLISNPGNILQVRNTISKSLGFNESALKQFSEVVGG